MTEPIKRKGAQYIGTLPDGYEWRMMEIGFHGLRLIGCHPKKGVIMYRLDGLTLVEEPIVLNPEPRTEINGIELPSVKELNELTFTELATAKLATAMAPKEESNCS